eukprot:snap_masked-scaffold_7-processed-gene-4.41-mRNA-1 protein AED:1.00 eAED:1.00 QI:0/-1/0/0/-1/1/1/0/65
MKGVLLLAPIVILDYRVKLFEDFSGGVVSFRFLQLPNYPAIDIWLNAESLASTHPDRSVSIVEAM